MYEYKKLHVENIEDGYQFEHVNSSEEDINMIFDVDIEDDITMEVSKHSRKQNRRKVISPKNARHLYRVHHNQSYTDHITHLENDPEEKIEEVKSSIEQLALQMAKQITYSLYSNTDRTVTNTEESSEDYFSNIVYNGDSVSYEYSHNGSQSFGESSQNA